MSSRIVRNAILAKNSFFKENKMKLVKSQRGNLLMQSAVALLIGALTVAGIVYFLGYINRAKAGAAVEQLQGLYIATINEAARPAGADTTLAALVATNNFSSSDWNSTTAPTDFELVSGDAVAVSPVGGISGSDTSALSLTLTPSTSNAGVDAQVVAKALNAGYILVAASATDAVGIDPTSGTLPTGITFTAGQGYSASTLGATPYYFVVKGSASASIVNQ